MVEPENDMEPMNKQKQNETNESLLGGEKSQFGLDWIGFLRALTGNDRVANAV